MKLHKSAPLQIISLMTLHLPTRKLFCKPSGYPKLNFPDFSLTLKKSMFAPDFTLTMVTLKIVIKGNQRKPSCGQFKDKQFKRIRNSQRPKDSEGF